MRPQQRRHLRANRQQRGDDRPLPSTPAAPPEGTVAITLDDLNDMLFAKQEPGRRRWEVPDQCDVDGCPHRITWPDADLVDLATGEELPGLFCDEHTIAYLRRPK